MDRGDDAQILVGALKPVGNLHHVGNAKLSLAAVDHWDDSGVTGGRLHQNVHARLFLQHFGDGGRSRVVKRPGRKRCEAVRLLRCRNTAAYDERGKAGRQRCRIPDFPRTCHFRHVDFLPVCSRLLAVLAGNGAADRNA